MLVVVQKNWKGPQGSSRGQLWREQLLSGLASGATALLWDLGEEEAGKMGVG